MIALALSVVAAKVVEYLVEIALALSVVAVKVEEYLVGIDLSVVAAKVVEYLVEIALALSVVAVKVEEYLVEIGLALSVVAAKVEEYLVGIDLSVVAAKVVEYLVEIGLALSVVAAKVEEYLVGIDLSVVAAKVVEYLVEIALYVAAKVWECLVAPIARPFRYIWNYKTNFDNFKAEETWIPSHRDYDAFESRRSTLKEILDALSDPEVNMVGIYGAGGIGKTTLVRAIAKHAEEKNLFDVVAFAVVAVKPDIKEIQQEIADFLGMTFPDKEGVSRRASRLQERLKSKEKVLLVLDNIWASFKLEEVGIPFGNDHKGCKLLLTARDLDVLSKMDSENTARDLDVLSKMDSESKFRSFQIGVLEKGEACSLFKKRACIENNDCLEALARKVAKACGGFPIAINSVAVALKKKEVSQWKDALKKLTTPSKSNFKGVTAEIYSCIEFSYNQLDEDELKSTFLLCCIMENIDIEDLLAYGKGLGIFQDVNTMEDARNRVNTLVQKLKDSSLLLDINNYWFSLHDVVRDVGTSIASRDRNMFRNCTIRELVDKDALKNCFAINLHNINELPKEFECAELQFFYMSTTAVDNCRFPENFFIGMPKLKVLHLVGLDLISMPNSIGLLVNLQTLYIVDCKLRDIDFIGEIKQLEILRICSYCSEIEMIPKKMCNLTGIRLLDLYHCFRIRNIPPNVLSTFTRLEELYLPRSIEWEVEGVNILDELKHLKLLTVLEISIPDTNVLLKGQLLSNKLERYRITFGSNVKSEFYRLRETSRRKVKLNLESSSCFDDVQKFLSVLDTEGFPELEHLWVQNSPCFRTVVDCLESESCHNHFLFLEWLNLHSVFNLERIHNHQLRAESFQRLTTLEVYKCNKLKNIFSFSTYRALPLLQQVYVSSCDNMEEIFAINRREEDINNDEGTDQIEFKQLRSLRLESLPKLTSFCSINGNKDMLDQIEFKQLHSLRLESLPKLTSFCSINGNKDILDTPTPLFNKKVTFPSLEEIDIYKSDNLKMVWHKRAKESFCNLKFMQFRDCNSLLTIFQFSMPRLLTVGVSGCALLEENFDLQKVNFEELYISWLPELKHIWKKDPQAKLSFEELPMPKRLSVSYCDLIEEIFDLQNINFEESHSEAITQQLQELDIRGLPKLKHIWNKDPQAELFFKSLQKVGVYNCQNLKDVFPASIGRSLLQLVKLSVENCGKLEEIVAKEGEAKAAVRFVFPEVTSIKLHKLPQLRTFYPGVHSSKWLVLKELEVVGCDKIELLATELFSFQENNEESHLEIPAQQPLFLVEKDSFQNLTFLRVWHCHGLKNLMTSSTAKSLVQLREMEIGECMSMIEVVTKEGDVTEEDEITFSKLRTLTLKGLPSLSCFCSENYTFELPSLEEIIVYKCPEMKCFSLRDVTTPILHIVKERWGGRRVYKLKGDLNTTIQQIQDGSCYWEVDDSSTSEDED